MHNSNLPLSKSWKKGMSFESGKKGLTRINKREIDASLLMARIFVGFICTWLLFGSFITELSTSYASWVALSNSEQAASAPPVVSSAAEVANINALVATNPGAAIANLAQNTALATHLQATNASSQAHFTAADITRLLPHTDTAISNSAAADKSLATTSNHFQQPNLQTLPTAPDLAISPSDITLPSTSITAGIPFSVYVIVHNIGNATASAGWVATYTDTDDTTGAVVIVKTTDSHPPYLPHNTSAILAGGINNELSNIPVGVITAGPHTLCVSLAATGDTNPDNDKVCLTILVKNSSTPAYQLAITSGSSINTWTGGSTIFVATVQNTGSSTLHLDPNGVSAAVSGSSNSVVTNPALANIPAQLAPGEKADLSFTLTTLGSNTATSDTLVVSINTLSGELSSPATKNVPITIASSAPATLQVMAVDADNSQRLANIPVGVDDLPGPFVTDVNGRVDIPVSPGWHNVSSINDTYHPFNQQVLVLNTGGVTPNAVNPNVVRIDLQPENPLNISVGTNPLNPGDAAALGVDTTNQANRDYYQFVLNYYVDGNPVTGSGVGDLPKTNPPVPTDYGIPSFPTSNGGSASGTVTVYPDGSKHDTWIIIPGDVSFLKQFWKATIFVQNTSSSHDITNLGVTLNVPAGLALPDLHGTTQPATKPSFTLGAGQGTTLTWVVRGDVPAKKYQLSAHGTGTFGSYTVDTTAKSGYFDVIEPKLSVQYRFPSYVESGVTVALNITVTNVSTIPIYDGQVTLHTAQLHNIHILSGTPDHIALTTPLAPGATSVVSFQLVPELTGCIALPPTSHVDYDPAQIDPDLILTATGICPGTDGHNLGDCPCKQGDPINPTTGNFVESFSDLSLPAPAGSNVGLSLNRTYNSQDQSVGLFGKGWHSSYDRRILTGDAGGTLLVINPDGRQDAYPLIGSAYQAPSRANSTLTKQTIGGVTTYTLVSSDQVTYTFDVTGALKSLADRNGNQITLTYNSGSIVVGSNFGETLTLTTTTLDNSLRITGATDGIRSVSYSYDSTDRLHQFTNTRGYTSTYGYDVNSYLNQLSDENNHLVTQNFYDLSGRVLTQTTYSGPTSAYTMSFNYNQSGKTIVTDLRGYTTTIGIDSKSVLPTRATDALGNTATISLDSNDNTTAITNTNGRVSAATYNSQGRITGSATGVTLNGAFQPITTAVTYNANNDPLTMVDTQGHVTSYGYTPQGNLAVMTDTMGQVTHYQYNAQGLVTQVTSFDGVVTTYGYNTLGQQTAVTNTFTTLRDVTGGNTPVMGTVSYRTDYTYTPQGWLQSQSDSYDVSQPPSPLPTTSYEYDAGGLVLTTTNQLGEKGVNQYDKVGNVITATNFLGQQTYAAYDWFNRAVTNTQHLASGDLITVNSYDANGNVGSTKDARGVVTTRQYNAINQLITTTVPLQPVAGVTNYVTTINSYNNAGSLASVTEVNNAAGGSGNQTTAYQYDELNRLITTTLGVGYLNYQTVNIYDTAGNMVQTKSSKGSGYSVTNWNDPAQVITAAISYDAFNRPVAQTTMGKNASNMLVQSYSYDNINRTRTTVNPYGMTEIDQKDGAGRVISTTTLPATGAQIQAGAQTQHNFAIYNALSEVTRTVNATGNYVDYQYDLLHRQTSTTAYVGPGTTNPLVSRTYYNDTTQPQVTQISPNTRQDTFSDEAGRTLKTTIYTGTLVAYPAVPAGALNTLYSHDQQGNLVSMTDSRNNTTSFAYDNTGWLKTVTQTVTPLNGTAQTLTTKYGYDLVGNRLSTTDAAGHTTTSSYDVLNRLAYDRERDVTSNIITYTYDGLSRVTAIQDAKGQVTNLTYDNASRLLQMNSTGGLNTSYDYDKTSQPIQMTDGTISTTTYSYDGLERLAGVTNPVGVLQYGYDAASRRTSMAFGPTTSSLKSAGYSYDGLGRPVNLTNWKNQNLTYTYTGTLPYQILYPNATTATYSYDGASRLTGINERTITTSNTIFSAAYTLDEMGNRTAVAENINGTTRNLAYRYDEISRLISETQKLSSGQTTGSTYLYDAVSNRQQMVSTVPANTKSGTGTIQLTTVYTYDVADRLQSRSDTGSATPFNGYTYNYAYDANGSLISETNPATGGEVTSYSYDSRNRMTGWQRTKGASITGLASFTYDGANNRTSMNYNGQTTTYLQDVGGTLPVAIQENTGGKTTSFLYPLGSTSPLFQTYDNTTDAWYDLDGLGSVRALTSQTGVVTADYAYSAFGLNAPTGDTSGVGGGGKTPNDHLYAGEQLDPTGLYYNRARYYNPSLGRFIGRDGYSGTGTEPTSQNRFIYADDNSPNWNDPSGKYHCDDGYIASGEYKEFCEDRKDYLDELRADAIGHPHVYPSLSSGLYQPRTGTQLFTVGLGGLLDLFTDKYGDYSSTTCITIDHSLPGASYGEAGKMRRNDVIRVVTTARERLEFVLWWTQAENFGYYRIDWGAQGFAPEFDDSPAGQLGKSAQVQHFLTAVAVGLTGVNDNYDRCAVGHELLTEGGTGKVCTIAGATIGDDGINMLDNFEAAIEADREGHCRVRETYIDKILPDVSPEMRVAGQSRADLRLTIKGIRLGRAVGARDIATYQDIGSWIRREVMQNDACFRPDRTRN